MPSPQPAAKTDPRFSHGPLLAVEALLSVIETGYPPVTGIERVPLRQALGRVLAGDLVSEAMLPPFDCSSVDGWAVAAVDLDGRPLPVGGRIAAGHPLEEPVAAGHAYRIFTGAPLPSGLDTVVMQEDARQEGDLVHLPILPGGSNRRRAGEAIASGQLALAEGTWLRPQELGLAASLGHEDLAVRRPLKVAVFSTGDEITPPGRRLAAGAIHDSNRFVLMGLLEGLHCEIEDLGILPDDAGLLEGTLERTAAAHDLLITSGGVSVGEEDHVRRVIAKLGHIDIWRLALKPGRPVALGAIRSTPVLALPGNPVAAMVTFLLFAKPLIARLAGARPRPARRFPVAAGFALNRAGGRREFARVRIEDGPSGPVAVPFPNDSSGILASMTESDGLVDLPAGPLDIAVGNMVAFIPFEGLLA